MTGQRDALLVELGESVLDALDAEARAPAQVWARRTGEAQMRRMWTGWPLEHPPVPAPLGSWEWQPVVGPVRVVPPVAKPKRRARKTRAAQAPGLGGAA